MFTYLHPLVDLKNRHRFIFGSLFNINDLGLLRVTTYLDFSLYPNSKILIYSMSSSSHDHVQSKGGQAMHGGTLTL